MADPSEASQLLGEIRSGNQGAAERLLPLVYEELRRLAAAYLAGERTGHTLQPTALVHEAFLGMVGPGRQPWEGRSHFFAVAARAMRNILVNHAQAARAQKRGGGRTRIGLDPGLLASPVPEVDALALSEVIDRLAALDARKARLVEMRFFGGMTMPEAAEALGVSVSTAEADWRFARAWLAKALSDEPPGTA